MLVGNNGILGKTSEAKIQTTVGNVKEELAMYKLNKLIENTDITTEELVAEGKVKRNVQQGEDGKYYIYYALKSGSFNSMNELGTGNIASLKDVFLIDDNLNVKYISSDGKEYGSDVENKILEDETKIRFSSKAFSEYVSKISGTTEENMKFKWMKNQTSLTIEDSSVDSLEDLVFFPNLTSLTLGDYSKNSPNIITMEGIENCTKLESLNIIYGPDKDYTSIKYLENLNSFTRYGGNDYDKIVNGLKFCLKLKTLYLAGMQNVDMKRISELTDLTIIRLVHCKIEKIDGLENKTNLKYLLLNENNITTIDGLTNLTNLVNIDLTSNNIKDITPLSNNPNLKEIFLTHNSNIDGNRENYKGDKLNALNKIGEILDKGGNIYLDADKLKLFKNYKKINLRNSELVTLDQLEGLTEITDLVIENTKVTLADTKSQEILRSMKKLVSLNLNRNSIQSISVINSLENLQNLYLNSSENNNLKDIEDIISNLSKLSVTNSTLQTITNCDVNKITKLCLTGNMYTNLPDLSKFEKLDHISLSGNSNIGNFNVLSKISSLKQLYLSNDNLHGRMINFSNLTNLTVLDLSNNNLWSEDLENLKALRNNNNLSIDLSKNSIIDGDALLELNSNTKINLKENVNLSQDSKNKLKEKFGNNVTF